MGAAMKTTARKRLMTKVGAALLSVLSLTPLAGCGGGCAGGGGAADLLDKLPATADGVILLDLKTFIPPDARQKLKAELGKAGADVSAVPDWLMNLEKVAVVGSWTASEPTGALVMTGAFNAEAVVEELKKSLDGQPTASALGQGAVVVGMGKALEATQAAWAGKGETLGSNEALTTLLGKVNRAGTLVIAGQDIPKLGGNFAGIEQLALSYDVSAGLDLKAWAKGDASLFEQAEKGLPMIKMGAAMMNKERLASSFSELPGIDMEEFEGLIRGAKELIDSLELKVSGDTMAVSGSTRVDVKGALPILAVVAIPAFIKYMRRAKTVEAIDQIDNIYKGAVIYFQDPKSDPNQPDQRLPCQFPKSVPCTPAKSPCDYPERKYPASATRGQWDAWAALTFEMAEPHYFQYCFESGGVGANAWMKVIAHGDLDCDGVKSTFTRMALAGETAVAGECTVRGSSAYTKFQETE